MPVALGVLVFLGECLLWWWAYNYLADRAEVDNRPTSLATTWGLFYIAGFLAPFMPFVYVYGRFARKKATAEEKAASEKD
ncbi:hypothetical protein [Nocardioides sp.]|uniref:hypothetical protein n=1 Tax=Nocardioides sp. TaxID=35761 RepID=UPI0026215392|nr:hypothetical protein [Nocardioides sp.]